MWQIHLTPKTSFLFFMILGLVPGVFTEPAWQFFVPFALATGLSGAYLSWWTLNLMERIKPLRWPRLVNLALTMPMMMISLGMIALFFTALYDVSPENMVIVSIAMIVLAAMITMLLIGLVGVVLDLAGCIHLKNLRLK